MARPLDRWRDTEVRLEALVLTSESLDPIKFGAGADSVQPAFVLVELRTAVA